MAARQEEPLKFTYARANSLALRDMERNGAMKPTTGVWHGSSEYNWQPPAPVGGSAVKAC